MGWKNSPGMCARHLDVSLNKSARKSTRFLMTMTRIRIITYNINVKTILQNKTGVITVMIVAMMEYHSNAVSFLIDSRSKGFFVWSKLYLMSK